MNFIKKVWEGKIDEDVKRQFQRFGRGEFKNRAMIEINTGKINRIKTSFEFANYLVERIAEKLNSGEKVKIDGIILTTKDISSDLKCKFEKKQFMGMKKFIIKTELEKEKILSICEKFPSALILFSFKLKDRTELKIKQKSPKSAKPSTKGEKEPKADFCSLKTSDSEIIKDFAFDIPNFKKVKINHTFLIENIELPKNEKDPEEIRKKAIRKGKIIRQIETDGKKDSKEIKFEI